MGGSVGQNPFVLADPPSYPLLCKGGTCFATGALSYPNRFRIHAEWAAGWQKAAGPLLPPTANHHLNPSISEGGEGPWAGRRKSCRLAPTSHLTESLLVARDWSSFPCTRGPSLPTPLPKGRGSVSVQNGLLTGKDMLDDPPPQLSGVVLGLGEKATGPPRRRTGHCYPRP